MALNFATTPSTKKDFGRVEDGAYPARIVQIIDFGIQHNTNWRTGKPQYHVVDAAGQWAKSGNDFVMTDDPTEAPDISPKVWINFELPDETIEIDGVAKPRWYGKEYTVSAHEKSALHALLKAVDGKGVATNNGRNVQGLLGLPAMLTIGSTSSGKAKVSAVSAVPKGMQVGALTNPEGFFDLDSDDVDAYEKLPNWMKTRIKDGVGFENTRLAKVLDAYTKHTSTPKEAVSVGDY